MPKNPYEWLYERESQPLKDYVLDEVTKRLAAAVEEYPPLIEEWEREDWRLRFAPLLAKASGPPDTRIVRCALKLFRWELQRDYDAIDGYMRGAHHSEYGLGPEELETAIFLWQYWLEETLSFKDYAQEKFLWRELIDLADRLQERLVDAAPPPPPVLM